MPVWQWSWTAPSISGTRSPTAATVVRTSSLQENGYLVLRFLAEDVGKDLDFVLDAILRALSNRRSAPAGHAIPAASPGSRNRC